MWQDLKDDKITLPKNHGQCLFSTRLENSWQSFLWVFESCVVIVRHTAKLQFVLQDLKILSKPEAWPSDLVAVDAMGGGWNEAWGPIIGAASASQPPKTLVHLSRRSPTDPSWTLTFCPEKATLWLCDDYVWRQDFILRHPYLLPSFTPNHPPKSPGNIWLTRANLTIHHVVRHHFCLSADQNLLYLRTDQEGPNHHLRPEALRLEGYHDHILDPQRLFQNYQLWDLHPNFSRILVLKAKPNTKEAGKFLFFSLPPLGDPEPAARLIGTTFSPDWSWSRLGHILHSSHTTFILDTHRSWSPHHRWQHLERMGGLRHTHETWQGTLLSYLRYTGEILCSTQSPSG